IKDELKRGNYVLANGKVEKITCVSEEYPFLDTIEYGVGAIDWKDIEPIYFEFHHIYNVQFRIPHSVSLVSCERFGGGSYFFWSWDTELRHPITYVHELQNWYFLLSKGQQVELNFEPKKKVSVCQCTCPEPYPDVEPKCITGLSDDKEITTDGEFIYSHEIKFAKIEHFAMKEFSRPKTAHVYFENIETGVHGEMVFNVSDAPELAELLKSKFKINE
ncbi:unnamed protein product, partial [marine sediment metagenome]